jgi:DNA-binding Xre family transcriptional regulator
MMKIANRVPELVAQKFGGKENINLSQVSKDVGLAYPTTSSWIKDQVVRADFPILLAWCRYLDCTPGDLLVLDKEGE